MTSKQHATMYQTQCNVFASPAFANSASLSMLCRDKRMTVTDILYAEGSAGVDTVSY